MEYNKQDFLETAGPQGVEQVARTRALTRKYNQIEHSDSEARAVLLRELFGAIGENVEIDTPFYCDRGKNIFIGSDVIININCTFVDNRPIHIGNQVLIASNVQIYTSGHPVLPDERLVADWKEKGTTFFRTFAKPVTIEDGVWIGGGTIILPGVTIGKNSVIGAGSVVTRSIPENSVAYGNPCRVARNF